ncbi:hypothetical protein JTE90_024052 [Oedothorax gibbosus]|uniref:Peptidase A2 domain-containing protein n=1 Tax=Oedothorax gibbosus TaxID=931172 RepID=A0AAV6VDG8_9ARAC|nr:hypothetical protein JTE90_024052 [Oedothorax gibbosus]
MQNFDQLIDLIIADQLKRKWSPELKDHYLDEWAECNDPGELADKFEAFENLRSGVRRGPNPDYKKRNFHKQKDEAPRRENFREPFPQRRDENRRPEARRENTRFNNRTPDRNGQEGRKRLQCFSCGSYEHLRNKYPRLGQRTQAVTNRVDVQPIPIEEGAPHILTAKISVPVSTPIDHKEKINELKKISLKCGANVIEGIVDTGAQISVIRADLISDLLCDGAGKIKIVSAFGETELAQLKVIHMKINDGRLGEVPITCAISEKLVSEMLIEEEDLRGRGKSPCLIPSSSHKLLKTWCGPATVVQLTRPHTALIEFEDKSRREFHFNKLRPYIARIEQVGLIFEQDEVFGDISYAPTSETKKSSNDIYKHILEQEGSLTLKQREDLIVVLRSYGGLFDQVPGQARVPGHDIRVTEDCKLKKLYPYRVPIALQDEVERQVRELLHLDVKSETFYLQNDRPRVHHKYNNLQSDGPSVTIPHGRCNFRTTFMTPHENEPCTELKSLGTKHSKENKTTEI